MRFILKKRCKDKSFLSTYIFFYYLIIDYESNASISKRGSHFQIKESILGRHRSSNTFISTNSSGHLHLSKSSLNSSSSPSISSCLSISPVDHDGRVDIKHNSEHKVLNALDSDGNARINTNHFNNIPASNSGVENEPSYNVENHKISIEKYSENQTGHHGYKKNKSSDLSETKNSSYYKTNNVCLGQNGNELNMTADSVFSSSNNSNHTTNVVNNVSSHNPSNPNSSLKTQKSFKHGSNQRPILIDDKNYKKEKEVVKEIGRFSPTPTPYVDFPLQFNFGSTYASSVTVFFDEN